MKFSTAPLGSFLSNELAAHIGLVVAAFSTMEIEIDAAISLMKQDAETAARLLNPAVIFEKRIDAFKVASRTAFRTCPSLAEKLREIAVAASALNLERNIIVHGTWENNPKGWCVSLIKGDRHRRVVDPSSLYALRSNIGVISATLRLVFWGGAGQGPADLVEQDERHALETLRGSALLRFPTYAGPWPPPRSSRA